MTSILACIELPPQLRFPKYISKSFPHQIPGSQSRHRAQHSLSYDKQTNKPSLNKQAFLNQVITFCTTAGNLGLTFEHHFVFEVRETVTDWGDIGTDHAPLERSCRFNQSPASPPPTHPQQCRSKSHPLVLLNA